MSALSNNPSPFLRANPLSRYFHSWLSELLTKAHKQDTLNLNDLYDIPENLQAKPLIDRLEANWFDEIKQHSENPSLIRATIRTTGWKVILFGLLLIPLEMLNIAQPVTLMYFMRYFDTCSTMSILEALLVALVILTILLCTHIIFHQYVYRVVLCGLKMKIAYNGLIFRKALRLSNNGMKNFSSGQITNLLSNDANKIEPLHYVFNYLWIVPLQIVAIVFILWYYIKYASFIAIGYTIMLLLLQPVLSRLFLHLRTQVLTVTDLRIKIMAEIIKSMRIMKMYCWESAFEKRVRAIRKNEVLKTCLFMICQSIDMILSQSFINVTFLLIFGLGKSFDTKLFALTHVLLSYMRNSSINAFNMAIRDLLNYLVAQKRIKKFLLLDESERDSRLLSTSNNDIQAIVDRHDISMKEKSQVICHVNSAQWEKDSPFSLKNIQFNAYPGDLICIIGSVASGKSSLLQTLAGEINYFDGKVRLYGSFCYVPQEAWIYSSTIKNNILFGKEYDHVLFQDVVRATALDRDFLHLPKGANTLVGDQGVMLSGGQKARINMARALYRNADIYLLDDPLSAVDAKISKHLFEKSIRHYLRDKICILVTHQIQFLQDSTQILLLDNGQILQKGTYKQLLESSSIFTRFLEDINQSEQPLTPLSTHPSIVESVASEDGEKNVAATNVELKQSGKVKWNVFISYMRTGLGLILNSFLIVSILSAQQMTNIYSNWWLAAWSNDRHVQNANLATCSNVSIKNETMNENQWKKHEKQRLYIYSGLVILLCILIFLRTVIIRLFCLNAARILHNKMFQRIIRCPISFFDTNPVGRILNRFTSDVSSTDDSLPMTVSDFLSCLSQVLGTIALVGYLNPWSFIPGFIAGVGMCFIRYRFAPCSRELKRLSGITRSPIFSQLASTIHGLKVIRSYHAENICSEEFHRHVNDDTRVNHLIATLNRWSAIRFDWMSLLFISFVIGFSIIARTTQSKFSSVEIALTLTYAINLMGLFQWTIRQSVEIENQMTSVERILEYCSLEQESSNQRKSKSPRLVNWPTLGEITFENLSMSHSNEKHSPALSLHNISFTIKSSEKIGIVGRTGAGKSSLIQTLFRMGTIVDGKISIDGVDITTIELDELRSRISIIPQDPVLFTGTMRSNLDQFDSYSDCEIWNALEQVQLKKFVIETMPDGLQSYVSESGSNLSVGQKQLVCLARAILKRSKILVIDEATANVDNVTDELIQKAIREKFKQCTVLTVAHRLRTIIDSDRIMVLNDGMLVEFDSPDVLLSNSESYFSALVKQTGPIEAQKLRELARLRQVYQRTPFESTIDEGETTETDPLLFSSKSS